MSLGCTGALRDASVGIRLVVASISTRLLASSNIRRSRSKSDLLNRRHVQLNQRNPVSPAAVHAAKSATEAIPILADDLESDPISSGFVASLAHPGRNIPGVFSDFPDFSMKWLQLLKEIIPALSRVRVLWDPATGSIQLDAVQAAGRLLNVKLDTTEIHAITELARAFADEQRPQAVIIL